MNLKNLSIVILVIILLVGSNIITGYNISSFSKRDRRLIEKRVDSLKNVAIMMELERFKEATLREKDLRDYNTILLTIQKEKEQDKILILHLQNEVSKIKKLNTHELISYGDSIYTAHH